LLSRKTLFPQRNWGRNVDLVIHSWATYKAFNMLSRNLIFVLGALQAALGVALAAVAVVAFSVYRPAIDGFFASVAKAGNGIWKPSRVRR